MLPRPPLRASKQAVAELRVLGVIQEGWEVGVHGMLLLYETNPFTFCFGSLSQLLRGRHVRICPMPNGHFVHTLEAYLHHSKRGGFVSVSCESCRAECTCHVPRVSSHSALPSMTSGGLSFIQRVCATLADTSFPSDTKMEFVRSRLALFKLDQCRGTRWANCHETRFTPAWDPSSRESKTRRTNF